MKNLRKVQVLSRPMGQMVELAYIIKKGIC